MQPSRTTTPSVSGISFARSTGPGSGRRRSFANPRRMASQMRPGDVPAVERQQRDEVEDEEGDVQRSEDADETRRLVDHGDLVDRGDLTGDAPDADDRDGAVRVAFPRPEGGIRHVDHALRQVHDDRGDAGDVLADRGQHRGDRLAHAFGRGPDADEAGLDGDRVARGIRHHLSVVVDDVTLAEGRRDGEGQLLAVALDDHRELLIGVLADDRGRLLPALDRDTVDRDDAVAGQHAGAGAGRSRIAGLAGLALARGGEHAFVDGADGRRALRHAEAHEQHAEQRDREHEVHERPAEHDDDALPHREEVERAVLVAGRDGLGAGVAGVLDEALEEAGAVVAHPLALAGREHADHRDVAAERNRLHAVLGLALALRPDRRAEPDHVLGDLDPEELRGHEVPDLVQADREGEADDDDGHADDEREHGIHPPSVLAVALSMLCSARAVASPSRRCGRCAHSPHDGRMPRPRRASRP